MYAIYIYIYEFGLLCKTKELSLCLVDGLCVRVCVRTSTSVYIVSLDWLSKSK